MASRKVTYEDFTLLTSGDYFTIDVNGNFVYTNNSGKTVTPCLLKNVTTLSFDWVDGIKELWITLFNSGNDWIDLKITNTQMIQCFLNGTKILSLGSQINYSTPQSVSLSITNTGISYTITTAAEPVTGEVPYNLSSFVENVTSFTPSKDTACLGISVCSWYTKGNTMANNVTISADELSEADNSPVLDPISNITTTINANFNISYNATDDNGISKHELSLDDGSTFNEISPSVSGNTYTYTTSISSTGTYKAKIRVTDTAGQTKVTSFNILVKVGESGGESGGGSTTGPITLPEPVMPSVSISLPLLPEILANKTKSIRNELRLDIIEDYIEGNGSITVSGSGSASSIWKGKVWNVIGDSITYGTGSTDGNRYYDLIDSEKHFVTKNIYGYFGWSIARTNNGSVYDKRTEWELSADLYTIFLGTNDYLHGSDIGTITDSTTDTLMGGLNLMLTYIMTNSPTAKIGVITPAKCICNGNSSFLEVNSKGNTLLDYCNAIEEVCAKYGAPCYNLYKNCNFNIDIETMKTTYVPDSIHLSNAGHKIISNGLSKFIERL